MASPYLQSFKRSLQRLLVSLLLLLVLVLAALPLPRPLLLLPVLTTLTAPLLLRRLRPHAVSSL